MMMLVSCRGSWTTSCLLGIGTILQLSGCGGPPAPLPVATAERPCPPFVAFPADNHSNAESPLLGCDVMANLRVMVANPADLTRGRPLGPTDGERQTLAVETYQQGKVKASEGGGAMTPQITMPTSGSSGGATP